MTDLLVGATAGLSSSASIENTAGQASSGTQTIIPLCHMPMKRTELLRTDIYPKTVRTRVHSCHDCIRFTGSDAVSACR
jgi:hypothetical protein